MTAATTRVATPLLAGLGLLSAFAVALVTVREGWNPVAVDYGVFWRAMHRPLTALYETGKYFVYPPSAIPLFKPFGFVPFWIGYVLWTIVSGSLFFAAARRTTDGQIALVAMLSSASLQNLLYGQTPMILSAFLLWAVCMPSLGRGMIMGVLACVKPQLFVSAPLVFLVRRDWLALTGIALGALGAIVVSVTIYGVQTWADWLAVMPSWGRAIIDLGVIGHVITPASIGIRLGLNPVPFWLLGASLAIFVVVRLSKRLEGANLAALIVGASALSVPYALPHDLVGAMPALSALILSNPSVWLFAGAALIYIGLLLPVLVPIAAVVAVVRFAKRESSGKHTDVAARG